MNLVLAPAQQCKFSFTNSNTILENISFHFLGHFFAGIMAIEMVHVTLVKNAKNEVAEPKETALWDLELVVSSPSKNVEKPSIKIVHTSGRLYFAFIIEKRDNFSKIFPEGTKTFLLL